MISAVACLVWTFQGSSLRKYRPEEAMVQNRGVLKRKREGERNRDRMKARERSKRARERKRERKIEGRRTRAAMG